MAKHTKLSKTDISSYVKDLRIGIVSTEWNPAIVDAMLTSAKKTLKGSGLDDDQIVAIVVPGAYELPLGAKLIMENSKVDSVICLGCVIKGETSHDEHINRSISSAIMQLGLMSDIPVIFGVLTTNDEKQAVERSGGKKGNKGEEAALAALKMIDLKKSFSKSKKKIGY